MKTGTHWFVMLFFLAGMSSVLAAEIVVVYPRLAEPDKPFAYADSLDSTFVFGRISPVAGELRVNGFPVPYTARGAFLAYLPLQRTPGTKCWEVALMEHGTSLASVAVPYVFQSEIPAPAASPSGNIPFPRVVRVAEDNSHTRTSPGGSYHLFPVKGTPLLAVGEKDGFVEFRLDAATIGFIERRFVVQDSQFVLDPVRVGDGRCRTSLDSCVCRFAVSRPLLWNSGLSPDERTLHLTLYGARLAVDRFRYASGKYLEEAQWNQEGDDVRLSLRFSAPLERGYDVTLANDSLSIVVRTPFQRRERNLKGKRIVVDPGHGGAADGTVGPLGTREKDVTLRWAKILAEELKRRGAIAILTRDRDVDVSLYDRVDLAKRNHADMLVSLHANALPDGTNPFVKHGSGTYFYQQLSHRAAAVLHRHLLKATGLIDDGIYEANFAVVRPSAFPAVLLEAAYLMYPAEEELLQSDAYLRRLTKGVANGLAEYFKAQS